MTKNYKLFITAILFLFGFYFIISKNLDLNTKSINFLIILYLSIFLVLATYFVKQELIYTSTIFLLTNIYFLFCYLGLFFLDKNLILNHLNPKVFNSEDFSHAVNILFYGYSTFVFGYFACLRILKNFKRKGFAMLNINNNEAFFLGVVLILLCIFLFYFLKIQFYIPGLAQLKYPILLFGTGSLVLFIATNDKKVINIKNFIAIILISIPLIIDLLGGSLSFPFIVLFLSYIFFCCVKKKLFISPFIIIIILFNFIHLGKYEFREITWNKTFNENQKSRLNTFINVYKDIILDGKFRFKKIVLCTTQDYNCSFKNDYRLEQRVFHSFDSLLYVTKFTKSNADFETRLDHNLKMVPYWGGHSYKILSSKLVPRIFWKDKPSDTLGNEFGRRYNRLHNIGTEKIDYTTSWNMPVLNEFYVNFGKKGVIFGMLMIGLFFGLITKFSNFTNIKNAEAIIIFYLFIPLFFLESHLSLLLGALIQSYIFLIIISIILLKIFRKFVNQ